MSDAECLAMPINRFVAFYKKMRHIELEEEAKQLTIVHNGKPNDRLNEILGQLHKIEGKPSPPVSALLLMNTPGVGVERQAGSIEALRERQKESARRLKAEWDAERSAGIPKPELFH